MPGTVEASEPSWLALRRRWALTAAAYLLAAWLGHRVLLVHWAEDGARRWLALSVAVMGYQLWFLWRNLGENRSGGGRLLHRFGPGTALTLLRGLLLGLLGGFLFGLRGSGWIAWAPALLYTAGGLCDYGDGYLARVSGHETRLGELLDVELDALGLLLAAALCVRFGALPPAFLALGLTRYAFLLGLWARQHLGKLNHPLPHSVTRRPIAGLSMGFFSVMLWPIVHPPATLVAGILFAVPLTASFLRDWMVVSGLLDPGSEIYGRVRQMGKAFLFRWLPLAPRWALLPLTFTMLRAYVQRSDLYAALFRQAGYPAPYSLLALFAALEAATLPLILAGVAGRLAALILLVPVALTSLAGEMTALRGSMLVCVLMVIMLGTGVGSTWKPEERFFSRRAGRAPSEQ